MRSQSGDPVTEILLVRHGQTDWNIQRRYQGHTNIPLNTVGINQARELARKLNHNKISAIYSSDLIRASKTAEILADSRNIPIILDARLREISMGTWEGRTWQEVFAALPEAQQEQLENPEHSRAEGGESVIEVAARMRAAADEISRAYPGNSVLLVSHGLSVAVLHCMAIGFPLSQARELIPENCSVVKVHWPILPDGNH